MVQEKASRRLPLRDLLTDADKRSRAVLENLQSTLLAKIADLRELSRPTRRKTTYPTLLAIQNSLKKVLELVAESGSIVDHLDEQLATIRDHAQKERFNRG